METDRHYYDDQVGRLCVKASLDMDREYIPFLLNTRTQITELRREMYHHRKHKEIQKQRQILFDTVGHINDKLAELNQIQVRETVKSAQTCIHVAHDNLDNPPCRANATWLAQDIHDIATQAIRILDKLEEQLYLKPFLVAHSDSIKTTRTQAEELVRRGTEKLCEMIRERQSIRKEKLAISLHQEQERRQKEENDKLALIKQQAEYARTALCQFDAAVKARDFEAATEAYQLFLRYGADVHHQCFPHDREMQLRRMSDRLRSLRDLAVGTNKVPVIIT